MMILKLTELMERQQISQNALAQRCGVKRQFIQRIANEQPPRISLSTIDKLCAALECQPGELLEYVADPAE
jgi:putative transcriptional regulator